MTEDSFRSPITTFFATLFSFEKKSSFSEGLKTDVHTFHVLFVTQFQLTSLSPLEKHTHLDDIVV